MDKELQDYLRHAHRQLSFERCWEVTVETARLLGQSESIVEAIRLLPLSPETRANLMRVSLVKGALATTAIEGNTLTEEEVADIQAGAPVDFGKSREYMKNEVENVLAALNSILNQMVASEDAPPVGEEMVLNFHRAIGQGLGESFQAVPGQYRTCDVLVGAYRPPASVYVRRLMDEYFHWLRQFRSGADGLGPFGEMLLKAIAAHVYFVWIHPFSDGNGRTARLVEFYLLVRGGVPNIASHILSNHYNQTRSEYYRHLALAGQTGELTGFFQYAAQGFFDGLRGVLSNVQSEQIRNAWRVHAQEKLGAAAGMKPSRAANLSKALSRMVPSRVYSPEELLVKEAPDDVARHYVLRPRSMTRDIKTLLDMRLICESDGKLQCDLSELVLPVWHASH